MSVPVLAPPGVVPLARGQVVAFDDEGAGFVCETFLTVVGSRRRVKVYDVGLTSADERGCRQRLDHDDTRRSVIAWLLEQAVPRAFAVWTSEEFCGEEVEEVRAEEWRRVCLRWAYPEDAARAPAEVLRLVEMVVADREERGA